MEKFKILTNDESDALSSAERRKYNKIKKLYDDTGVLKKLTEDEIQNLSTELRNEYLQRSRELYNTKMVKETANQVIEDVSVKTLSVTSTAADSTPTQKKKSKAGRKKKDESIKRKQFMLTLSPLTSKTIEQYAIKNLKKPAPIMNALLDNVIFNIIKPYISNLEEVLEDEDKMAKIIEEHYDEIEEQIKFLLI